MFFQTFFIFRLSNKTELIIVLLTFFFFSNIRGQDYIFYDVNDISFKSPFTLNSNLRNNLEIYSFDNFLSLNLKLIDYKIFFQNNYNGQVVGTKKKSVREKNENRFFIEKSFSDILISGVLMRLNYYNDNKNISLNKSKLEQAGFYLGSAVKDFGKSYAAVGMIGKAQLNEKYDDFFFSSKFESDDIALSDFNLKSNFYYYQDQVKPLNNRDFKLNFHFNYEEEEIFKAKFIFARDEFLSSFLLPIDSSFQNIFNKKNNSASRKQIDNIFENILSLENLIEKSRIEFKFRYNLKDVNRIYKYKSFELFENNIYDSKNNQILLNTDISILLFDKDWNLNAKFSYNEKNENFNLKRDDYIPEQSYLIKEKIEKQKDNKTSLKTIALDYGYKASNVDIIQIIASHNKKIYNTPSVENYDDRDELLSAIKIGWSRRFNSFFSNAIFLEGSRTKISYISGKKSSNNFVGRFLRLLFEPRLNGGIIKHSGIFEVGSNYIVYDYSKLFENLNDYYFRNLTIRDTITLIFTSFEIESRVYLNYSEQGKLNWKKFKVSPSIYWNEINLSFILNFSFANSKFGFGAKNFSSSRYLYLTIRERKLSSSYEYWGPICEILYKASENFNATAQAFIEYPSSKGKYAKRTFFDFSTTYFF